MNYVLEENRAVAGVHRRGRRIKDGYRNEIIRSFLKSLHVSRESDLIPILQVMDYLSESIMVKKDADEKLTKEHLLKDLKYNLVGITLRRASIDNPSFIMIIRMPKDTWDNMIQVEKLYQMHSFL